MYATTPYMELAAQYCEEDIYCSVLGFEQRVLGTQWQGMGSRMWNEILYRQWVKRNKGKRNSEDDCKGSEKVYWRRREVLQELKFACWIQENERKERKYEGEDKLKYVMDDILKTDNLAFIFAFTPNDCTPHPSKTSVANHFDATELEDEDRILVEGSKESHVSCTYLVSLKMGGR